MAGKSFLVVDEASLSEALAEADADDRVVVADGAFERPPVLVRFGGRWIVVPDGAVIGPVGELAVNALVPPDPAWPAGTVDLRETLVLSRPGRYGHVPPTAYYYVDDPGAWKIGMTAVITVGGEPTLTRVVEVVPASVSSWQRSQVLLELVPTTRIGFVDKVVMPPAERDGRLVVSGADALVPASAAEPTPAADRPEAILPLKRFPDGELGVDLVSTSLQPTCPSARADVRIGDTPFPAAPPDPALVISRDGGLRPRTSMPRRSAAEVAAGIVAWIRRDAPGWSDPEVALAIADEIEAGVGWRTPDDAAPAEAVPVPVIGRLFSGADRFSAGGTVTLSAVDRDRIAQASREAVLTFKDVKAAGYSPGQTRTACGVEVVVTNAAPETARGPLSAEIREIIARQFRPGGYERYLQLWPRW